MSPQVVRKNYQNLVVKISLSICLRIHWIW